MIDRLYKVVNLVAMNQQAHDKKMQEYQNFANRKKVNHEKAKSEKDGAETFENKEQQEANKPQKHWLWDNKWYKLLKALIIAFLLLKAFILFWNEIAKLISAAKRVEKAMAV